MIKVKKKDLKKYANDKIYTWDIISGSIIETCVFDASISSRLSLGEAITNAKSEEDEIEICENRKDCLIQMKENWLFKDKPIDEIKKEIRSHKSSLEYYSNMLSIRKEINALEEE